MKDFIYVTIGTGIGAAIIINSGLYRGMTGNAGELGHIIIDAMQKNKSMELPFTGRRAAATRSWWRFSWPKGRIVN